MTKAKHKFPIRLILSVMAGIAISMVLSTLAHLLLHAVGIFPELSEPIFDTNLLIISLVYHSLFAIIAAFFTAKFAKDKARKAVFILGSKEAIMWLLGIILLWHHSPAWFNITKAVLGPPLAWIGGLFWYGRYKEKHKS